MSNPSENEQDEEILQLADDEESGSVPTDNSPGDIYGVPTETNTTAAKATLPNETPSKEASDGYRPSTDDGDVYGVTETARFVPPPRVTTRSDKEVFESSDHFGDGGYSLEAIYERRREEKKKALEKELSSRQERRALPDHPFREGLFLPLITPGVLLRVAIMAGMALLPFYLALRMFHSLLLHKYLEEGYKLTHFLNCLWQDKIVLFLFCFLWGALSIPYILHVFGATADGDDKIDEWPEYNFIGGFGQFLWLTLLVLIAGTPGYLLLLPTGHPMMGFIGSAIALTPIFFLSCMESDTLFTFITRTVLLSLKRLAKYWGTFYLACAGLFLITVASTVLSLWLIGGKELPFGLMFLTALLISLIMSVVPIIYLRLLGRLAWVIADDRRNRGEEEEEQEEYSDSE